MIATQGSASREIFARALETARRKLRETIEKHPDALLADNQPLWSRGFFPGALWCLAQNDPEWWRDQAVRYSQPLTTIDGDGLGFALLPSVCRWADVTHDPVAQNAVIEAARRIKPRISHQPPTVSSLMDALVLFHADAIVPDSELRLVAFSHALAARRFLVRGDGSLAASDASHDLGVAIYAFGAVYQYTRDARFLSVAESCAAYLLESLPADGLPGHASAEAIAASALLQLSSLASDPAKARFYSLAARQLLLTLEDQSLADKEAEYFFLDALTRAGEIPAIPALTLLFEELPRNGVVHSPVTALVEPPAPEPEPEPEKQPEPRRNQLRPLIFLLAPILFFLLIDFTIFRSNFYTRFIEPESSEGTFEGTFEHEKTRALTGGKAILVLGSSRIAEGFSAKQVNQLEPKGGYFFINGAVSGAGPRCMYYFVRDLDPQRNRYKAIVMTVDDYTDPDDYEDLANREEDLHSVIARLRFSDIPTFTQSFTTRKTKWTVFAGSLLKSTVYQRDLQEFLDHPQHRLEKAALYRGHRFDWSYDYGGSDHSLAGTTVDWATKTITFPPNIPQPEQDYLRPRLIITAPQNGRVRAYQTRWLGAFADLYRNSKTRIIFIQAPRTPLPRPVSLAHWPWTTVDELAKRPWVSVVDPHTFENLERPELFSDYAHLNSAGQKLFSPALASTLKSILEAR